MKAHDGDPSPMIASSTGEMSSLPPARPIAEMVPVPAEYCDMIVIGCHGHVSTDM